jgi:hypothetical protein
VCPPFQLLNHLSNLNEIWCEYYAIIRAMIALMMEAVSTSETSVNLYQTTQRYNPEDSHLLPDYTALQPRI